MRKIIFILFLFVVFLLAEDVKITADKFQADEINKISTFEGNVKIEKGKDIITTENLTILFGADNKPVKYIAKGNPKFKFSINDKRYEGKAKEIIYLPQNGKYILIGDVFVNEKTQDRKIYGDRLEIDKENGKIKIFGKKNKPVKFIFRVNEK